MKPFGVMADLHCHAWSAFAGTDEEGRNTRLMEILHEIDRCCEAVGQAGGELVVIAGDVFHVRGRVAPSVFNPVKQCLQRHVAGGMRFDILPGNHDLEGKDARELTSAVAMLEAPGIRVLHRPFVEGDFAYVPWRTKRAELLDDIAWCAKAGAGDLDLFIHAGIDGVLDGVPAHGLTAEQLADFGFRRVWAGDYHNARMMANGKVISVGAPVHHTWSDVGVRAGWWVVDDIGPRWFASHAPRFIDITGDEDPAELPLIVDGHYVRAKIGRATAAEVAAWREKLAGMGARGVVIQATPATAAAMRRANGVVRSIDSLEESVARWCEAEGLDAAVAEECRGILGEVVA